MLKDNYENVEKSILSACNKVNRNASEVTLISVSKTKPVNMLQEIYNCGSRNFGENKVQEITEKYPLLPADIKWHMIGHLQRNKVKYIIDKVKLIHSVDSYRLAEEINIQAKKKNMIMPILIEVNVANEVSKFGVSMEETLELIKDTALLENVSIKGLMTIAPYVENPEDNRAIFRQLKELFIDIRNKNIDNVNMDVLSMGMTNDYMVAIEEGATMVRVGTGIFGERNYSINN